MKRIGAVKWENRELIGVGQEVINNFYLFVILNQYSYRQFKMLKSNCFYPSCFLQGFSQDPLRARPGHPLPLSFIICFFLRLSSIFNILFPIHPPLETTAGHRLQKTPSRLVFPSRRFEVQAADSAII